MGDMLYLHRENLEETLYPLEGTYGCECLQPIRTHVSKNPPFSLSEHPQRPHCWFCAMSLHQLEANRSRFTLRANSCVNIC